MPPMPPRLLTSTRPTEAIYGTTNPSLTSPMEKGIPDSRTHRKTEENSPTVFPPLPPFLPLSKAVPSVSQLLPLLLFPTPPLDSPRRENSVTGCFVPTAIVRIIRWIHVSCCARN